MRFAPKTEEEANSMKLLKEGECEFTVMDATDEQSDSGNDMIKVKLEVFDADGQKAVVFDYLLEKMALKLRHFCYATGNAEKYEAGDFSAEDCLTCAGRCIVRTEKDKSGKYADKNKIIDYVVDDSAPQAPTPSHQQAPQVRQTHRNSTRPAATLSNPSQPQKTYKIIAWEAFCSKNAGNSADDLADAWRKLVAVVFPGKTAKELTEQQWQRVHAQIISPPTQSASPAPGFDESVFKDDDIPF